VGGLLVLRRGVQGPVVGVVFGGEEAAFGVGHLAEVVFDELGEVARGADVVQGAEAGGVGGRILAACIAVGGGVGCGCGCGCGGVGALLAGEEVVGGEVAGGAGERGGVLGLLALGGLALGGFALGAQGFGFESVDFLGGRLVWVWKEGGCHTYDSFDLFGGQWRLLDSIAGGGRRGWWRR